MPIVRHELKPDAPISTKVKRNLKQIARIRDEDIDLSDIPEWTEKMFASAVRDGLYRPVKERVTIRLDKDVLAFYRREGMGYQTRINKILRDAMQVALRTGKRKTLRS
jgi:uncharacterized protein (DUF4415 family)